MVYARFRYTKHREQINCGIHPERQNLEIQAGSFPRERGNSSARALVASDEEEVRGAVEHCGHPAFQDIEH